jgi:mRNA interferase MazF
MTAPDPGDVVLVNFPGVEGIKRRPAIVISSQTYHATRPDVIVELITTRIAVANGPTDCLLEDWEEAGLRQRSAFRTYLATMLQVDVIARIGRLSDRDWKSVCVSVRKGLAALEEQ